MEYKIKIKYNQKKINKGIIATAVGEQGYALSSITALEVTAGRNFNFIMEFILFQF